MTERYKNGKIYKLTSVHTDKIYIGSTCKVLLSQRLATHKSYYKCWTKNNELNQVSSFYLFNLGDVEIILLELYPCLSKDQLLAKEKQYIEQFKNICLNKNIPTQTKKEYVEKNKNIIKEKYKIYYDNNRDQRIKSKNDFRKNNKEHCAAQAKRYYENNKEKYNKYKREYRAKEFICHCGYVGTNGRKYDHIKTKHKKSIE